jgi:predicted MFS family arabinose efflux permease
MVHLNSVEQWRQRWNKFGLAGLYEGHHTGRPRKWTSGQRQALGELALSTVGFDLGVQASLISHQTIVYGIAPEARSRLNAILMTNVFIGMAAGGLLGAQVLASWGWTGVVLLATVAAAGALLVRLNARQ